MMWISAHLITTMSNSLQEDKMMQQCYR